MLAKLFILGKTSIVYTGHYPVEMVFVLKSRFATKHVYACCFNSTLGGSSRNILIPKYA